MKLKENPTLLKAVFILKTIVQLFLIKEENTVNYNQWIMFSWKCGSFIFDGFPP